MQSFSRQLLPISILILVCFITFGWRLGRLGLVDPDEPFYAQTCMEMAQSGDWLTPRIYGEPQFEKPILYYWLVAGSYKLFGVNEFAGRLPSAIPAALGVLAVYAFGLQVFSRRAAFLSALILATGVEYAIMSRLMLTDIALALLLAGAMFSLWFAIERQSGLWMFFQLVFGGLAVLMKGPIGTLIPLMGVGLFLWRTKQRVPWKTAGAWWGLLAWGVIVIPWYALMFRWYPQMIWEDFFIRDNWLRFFKAEHPANNHIFYYMAILLAGSIPWMPVVATALGRAWRQIKGAGTNRCLLYLWCWILTSWVFLTLAQSKLPSYIFYLFIPLALVAGVALDDLISKGFGSRTERVVTLAISGLQAGVALAALGLEVVEPFHKPVLAVGLCLAAAFLLLWRNQLRAWVALSACVTMLLVVSSLTVAFDQVQALSSAKPLAARMLELRKENEPLLGSKFLVRGIRFYTGDPASVFAGDPQPFWAAHPLPVVVWKHNLMEEFLTQHGSALCAIRKSEWRVLQNYREFAAREGFVQMGDNILVRARLPK